MQARKPFVKNLAILCAVAAVSTLAGWPAAAQDAGDLRRQLSSAFQEERWDDALAAALSIVKLDPSNPTSHYNVACVLSRKGDLKLAVEALQHAAELGFSEADHLRADLDLAALRDHPGYQEALRTVEATAARKAAELEARIASYEPLIFGPPRRKLSRRKGRGDDGLPLVIFLHGRGGRADQMAEAWRPSAAKIGAVLIVPEAYERFLTGYQWGSVEDSIRRLEEAIEYAAERFPIDRQRVVVGGFSQGAYVALEAAARNPQRIAGTIAIGACIPRGLGFRADAEPPAEPPPLYIGIGSKERSFDDCKPMADLFRSAGFKVDLRVFRGYGHVFPRNYEWEFDRALRFVLPKR